MNFTGTLERLLIGPS